jgi:glycosyltransferase involved in cell wall biosynthesis
VKKKILVFTGNFLPLVGGAELVIYNICKNLHTTGYDVLLLCGGTKRDSIRAQKMHSIHFPVVRYPYRFFLSGQLGLNSIISFLFLFYFMTVKGYKTVHAHWAFHPGFVCSVLKKIVPFRFILTLHGGNDFQSSNNYNAERYFLSKRKKAVRAVQAADFITAISPSMQADIEAVIPKKHYDRIKLIPNGFDPDKLLHGDAVDIRKRHIVSSEECIILSVGRNDRVKNHEYKFRILNQLRVTHPAIFNSIRMIIIGPGCKSLSSLNSYSTVSDRVILIDELPQNDLSSYYKQSTIYLQTSLVEGFGMTVVEAMAFGKPIMVTDVPGLRDLVSSKNGFVLPLNCPEKFSEAIADLCMNDKLLNLMSISSVMSAQAYQWGNVMEMYKEVYSK